MRDYPESLSPRRAAVQMTSPHLSSYCRITPTLPALLLFDCTWCVW
jgi:hypothetical protein